MKKCKFPGGPVLSVGLVALAAWTSSGMADDENRQMWGWEANDKGTRVDAPSKAIQCGQLLDVPNREILGEVTILIESDRIVGVEFGRLSPQDADAVIDLGDQVCLPGIIDAHVHFAASFIRTGETHRPQDVIEYTVAETAFALANARETLYTGVTTVRSPGEMLPGKGPLMMRDAIRQGYHPGPRIFLADHQIGYDFARNIVVGAGEDHYELRKPNEVAYDPTVPGESDVRQAVRDALSHGEDWIKVSVDVAGLTMPAVRLFSAQELKDMADEAHKQGAKITAHINSDEAVRDAILAGFDSLEHAYVLSRENADLMKEHGVWWSLTLADLRFTHDPHDPLIGNDVPLSYQRDVSEQMARRDEGFRYAYEIGVPMVYASDGWFNPGNNRGRMVLEFSEYLNLGVTPWEVLTYATVNGAKLLDQTDNLGSIEPGKYADIIALPRNPLDDITAFNDINFVMKGGEVFRDDLHRNPLPDVYAMEFADVTFVVEDGEVVCKGSDCQ